MEFKIEMEKRAGAADMAVKNLLPKAGEYPGMLAEAMVYSVIAGGKRLRPVMMYECYKMFGGAGDEIEPYQAAMEFIHNASLTHDDLPAIDNDTLRRGKETTFAKFGEAVGILAGDALLNYAYEVLIKAVADAQNKETSVRAAGIIADKSGYAGMLGGQDADVESEKTGVNGDKKEILYYIYKKKTAALIEASMMAGAALAGASDEYIGILEKIGENIGLAYQIQDDILDVTSTTDKLGKPIFSDIRNNKDTYVSLFGLDEAREEVKRLTNEALNLAASLPGDTSFFSEMLRRLAFREK